MERHIPSNILCLLENWFAIGALNGSQHSQVSLACLAVLDKAVFYRHIYLHYILMVL